MTEPFRLSASKLKKYLTCPRSYFLHYVQRADQNINGKFLDVGNAFDLAVQYYCSGGRVGVQSIDPKIVKMLDVAKRHLPRPGEAEVQREYRIDAGGFFVEGKPDLRRRGRLGDTKTTADKGRGRGRGRDENGREMAPIALNERTILTDVQPLMYGWCELMLDSALTEATLEWVYVTKESKPTSWTVCGTLPRAAVEHWFETVARPAAAAMRALHEEFDSAKVRANLDACDSPKCWVRAACDPYDGPNNYDAVDGLIPAASLKRIRPLSSAEKANEGETMAFDLKQLSANQTTLEEQLQASIDAVVDRAVAPESTALAIAINPPARPRKAKPAAVVADPVQVNLEDLASELQTCVDTCNGAISRIDRLLAQLRGGK